MPGIEANDAVEAPIALSAGATADSAQYPGIPGPIGQITSNVPQSSTMEITSKFVTQLSQNILLEPMKPKWDSNCVSAHLSPSFFVTLDSFPIASSAAEYVQSVETFLDRNSGWKLSVVRCACVLRDEGRRATVWVTTNANGVEDEKSETVAREAVSRFKWRRLRGMQWICTSCHVVRGPGQAN
jgi:hypothetical protein